MAGATDVITILGKRGSGKSTLAWEFAKLYPRLVTFDPLNEHDESRYTHVVDTFDDFSAAILATAQGSNFRILYRFDVESDSHDEEFNHAQRILYYRGNVAILVEEVWIFSGKGTIPKWLRQSYLTGRHRGLALIVTSQRPASVHKDIMAQTNQFFSGTMFESNDVRYLAEFLGKDNAESLRNLPPFQFLHYRPGHPAVVVKNKT